MDGDKMTKKEEANKWAGKMIENAKKYHLPLKEKKDKKK